jgi:hypothetical protein
LQGIERLSQWVNFNPWFHPMRFYNFKRVQLVHIGIGPAAIDLVADSTVAYTDGQGDKATISLVECARICRLLKEAGGFPPDGDIATSLMELKSILTAERLKRHRQVGLSDFVKSLRGGR